MNTRRTDTGVLYLPAPEHPCYRQRFGWQPEQWSNAMRIGQQTVGLPLSPKLTNTDIDRVIDSVRAIVSSPITPGRSGSQ